MNMLQAALLLLRLYFVESTGTTASPPHRGRKTTRHIAGKVTRHIVPPTPTSPEYGMPSIQFLMVPHGGSQRKYFVE